MSVKIVNDFAVAPTVMEFSDMAVTDGQGAELMCTVRGAPLPSIVWLREESDVIYEEEKEEVCGRGYSSVNSML